MTSIRYKWFPGLNALRFCAALLVVLMHLHLGMKQAGLPILREWPVLLKGYAAVSFFFVLSGFLITYLLLSEKEQTGSIAVKRFYWRRVFRIWPLYFLVVAGGLLFYHKVLPFLGIDFEVEYSAPLALLMYGLFAANFFNSFYHVGGLLHITWSIAVEEQFYLFWAPIVKKLKEQAYWIIGCITLLFLFLALLNEINFFGLSIEWQNFLKTLQFHYMGIGAAAAWSLYYYPDKLLHLRIFRNKTLQILLFLIILFFYGFYSKSSWGEALLPLPMGLLYAWLIINVSVNPRKILNLENSWTHFLGNISFGIYMLHMPFVYGVCFAAGFLPVAFLGTPLYFVLIGISVLLLTLLAAYLSNRYLEMPFNTLGKSLLSGVKTKQSRKSAKEVSFKHLIESGVEDGL